MLQILEHTYKEILGITDNTEDEFVELAQYEIEAKVKNYLNRELEASDYTEYYDGLSTDVLVLNQFPINSVSKIEYYDGLDSNNDEVWNEYIQGTDYERLNIYDGHISIDGTIFDWGSKNIKVTYNAGYTTIPYEIQQACKKLMLLVKKNRRPADLPSSVASLLIGQSDP